MTFFASYKELMQAELPRMKKAAAAIVIFFSFVLGVFSGTVFPNAFSLVILSLAAASVSALLFMFRSPYVYLSPLLSFPAVFIVTGTPEAALFSVSYVPVSVILAIALYKKKSKAHAVFAASLGFGATVLLFYGILRLSGHDILPAASDFRTDLVTLFSSFAMNTKDGRVPLLTEDAARGLADYIMLSLPAIFITAVNTVGFLSASALSLLCRIFFFSEHIPNGKWEYMPDITAAAVFIISYFVSSALVPYKSADVIGFAAENMLLALTPAMMIAGEKAAFVYASKNDRRIIFVFLSVFILALSISMYLMIVSFLGAIHVMYQPLKPHIKKLFKKNDDDDEY